MAQTPEEVLRQRRRRRLVRGLLVGAAAIGVPAVANAVLARRAKRLPAPAWGTARPFAWGGSETLFHRLGQGEPVVLLHSLGPGHSGLEWRRAAEILARRYSVLVPDLPGFGDSPKPLAALDSRLYRSWLGDFLEGVVRKPALLLATGRSAAYSLAVAARRSSLIHTLGLVVPRGLPLAGDRPDLRDRAVQCLLRTPVLGTSALNVYTSRTSLDRYLKRDVYCDSTLVTDDVVNNHYRAAHLPGRLSVLAALLSGQLDLEVDSFLADVQQPVWIAWGRAATSPAVESADLWLSRLPKAELEVFPGAALLPHAETPRLFCAALQRFLGPSTKRDAAC